MPQVSDRAWLLLIPFLAILAFEVWVLWSFSAEIRRGQRRRVRSAVAGHQIDIYAPQGPVLRFRSSREREAA